MAPAPPIHPVDLHVGRLIRRLRRARGLSQTQLAQGLGLTFQQVQKYERGLNRISASKLYEAAGVLGVPMSALFEGLPPPQDEAGRGVCEALNRRAAVADSDEGVRLLDAYEKTPPPLRAPVLALLEQLGDQIGAGA